MSKRFHLGDVLSITTETLLSPRLIEGVYDILDYMTGDDLYTHQLPRAADECRPYLLKQFPELADVNVEGITEENHMQRLEELAKQYGEWFEVEPLPRVG